MSLSEIYIDNKLCSINTRPMENTDTQTSENSSKSILVGMWIVSVFAIFGVGYIFGQATKTSQNQNTQKVMGVESLPQSTPTTEIEPTIITPTINLKPTEKIDLKSSCTKSGFAQKWEYLISYTIKEGDSLQSIAENEMGDSGRTNEILQLNGVGPLVVGSTLYLPPKNITKSNGKIRLLYGKLVLKNASNWQLSFNDDKEGQGILIPTFWFADILGKDSYKLGDCLEVLLDDGFKVFSVKMQ